MIEVVEQSRPGGVREPQHRDGAQVMLAEHRLQAAGERRVGKHRVEIHRRLGHRDRMAPGRYGAVQVGERFGVVERRANWHQAREQVERPIGLRDRSEETTSELQSLMRPTYDVLCLKKTKK